jgi:hypothetical protein
MRTDMFKVIVERPRGYKGSESRADRRRDDFEGPHRLGMRAGYGYRALNENLRPLQRYLRSQVGRPWNKVYSEIARTIDRRNTVQQHVYQHIEDFVAVKVAWKDGNLVDLDAYGASKTCRKSCTSTRVRDFCASISTTAAGASAIGLTHARMLPRPMRAGASSMTSRSCT